MRLLSHLAFPVSVLLVAVFVFTAAFFPLRPLEPGAAASSVLSLPGCDLAPVRRNASFDRVALVLIDACRPDVVLERPTRFTRTASLIGSGVGHAFTAVARPPTVTLPRLKALTTGAVPGFLDVLFKWVPLAALLSPSDG